jgi:hypothetical protein
MSFLTKTIKDALAKVNALPIWTKSATTRLMTNLELMQCLAAFGHRSVEHDKEVIAELRKVRIPC